MNATSPKLNAGQAPAEANRSVDPHEPSPLDALLEQPSQRYRLALEPQTFDEGWRVAGICAKLRLCGVLTQEDGYARILTGRAIGLPAMASIQGIRLIENQRDNSFTPCMYVKLKVGLLLSRPDVIEYIRPDPSNDDKKATWRAKRRGQPEQEYTFTIEDAERAGLIDRGASEDAKRKNNYNKHPRPMISWRAAGRLCDNIAGDILNGIASREDVEEDEERGDVTSQPVANAPPPAPARDWSAETARLKDAITEASASQDKVVHKAAREMLKKFQAEAPQASVDEVLAHYNGLAASKKAAATQSANGSAAQPAAPTQTETASIAPVHTAAAARAAQAARTSAPRGTYLPPNARGDAYDGPETPNEPEPPFG